MIDPADLDELSEELRKQGLTPVGKLVDPETDQVGAVKAMLKTTTWIRDWAIPAIEDQLNAAHESLNGIAAEMETQKHALKSVLRTMEERP